MAILLVAIKELLKYFMLEVIKCVLLIEIKAFYECEY